MLILCLTSASGMQVCPLPWLDATCLGMLMLKTSDIAIDRKKLYSQVCLCCGLKDWLLCQHALLCWRVLLWQH